MGSTADWRPTSPRHERTGPLRSAHSAARCAKGRPVSLSSRLLLYVLALHALFLAFSWRLFIDTPWLFVAVEVMLVCSLVGGWHLVRRALAPLQTARQFRDLLQDQHYAARLLPGDGRELGELVEVFNRMLGALHDERLKIGEQQGFLDRLLEATPSAVVVFDFDGRVSLRNASALALLGTVEPTTDDGLWPQLRAVPLGEAHLLADAVGRRFRAQRGRFFDRGFARDFLLVEELTHELERSERATYEKLIRVLAHEVNNTVAATGSVLDSLTHYSDQIAAADRLDFNTAVRAVKHRNANLGEFIERFTRVAKMPEPELHPASVAELLENTARLYAETCSAQGIALVWTCRDAECTVPLDRHLIEQALLNVLKNAVEATQATKLERPAQPARIELAVVCEARAVHLSVTDSGDRLGEVPAEQLFSPFFTSKKGGQGIGLLFVREVLQRHGFAYRIAATGHGQTRFDIWFTTAARA